MIFSFSASALDLKHLTRHQTNDHNSAPETTTGIDPCASILLSNQQEIQEQRSIQISKDRIRTLTEYDMYIFKLAAGEGKDRFLKLLGMRAGLSGQNVNFLNFLNGLSKTRKNVIRWSDEGAGFAIPMRELRRDHPELAQKVESTAIDLFDWDNENDEASTNYAKKTVGPNIFDPVYKPTYQIGNMADVTAEQQDLITSIESIQYIPDKIGAIVDWYNKLRDGGLVIIAADHYWSEDIGFALGHRPTDHTVLLDILHALRANAIPFAAIFDMPSGRIRTLAIQKVTDTKMRTWMQPMRVVRNRHGYVLSYYAAAAGQSIVQIEKSR